MTWRAQMQYVVNGAASPGTLGEHRCTMYNDDNVTGTGTLCGG
jgi:hypothetical protein